MRTPNFLLKRGITQVVTLDFETYYSVDYTLRKISTSLYIFDPRFLVHGLGININGVTNYYRTESEIRTALAKINWDETAVLMHHAHFDSLILFYHYGVKPAYYLDTLSMARPVLQNVIKSLSLDAIAKHIGIQGKLEGLEDTKGKRTLTIKESVRLGIYCKNDIDITIPIFEFLFPYFTELEMDVIHYTIKMYADPKLVVDEPLIDLELKHIRKNKAQMFESVKALLPPKFSNEEVVRVLRSGDKLAEVLQYNGIISPTKISKTTGKETHAFARTDLDFQKLEASENENARLLYKARLASKSDTALNKAIILKKFAQAKCCPVYLNYWKAQTGRFCIPGTNELLTKDGWVKIQDWQGQKIAQWNNVTNEISFVKTAVSKFNSAGIMCKSNSPYMNGLFTQEHKIPIYSSTGVFSSIYANELQDKTHVIPISGILNDSQVTKGIALTTTQIQLLVATQADAHVRSITGKSGRYIKFNFNKPRKVQRLLNFLNAEKIPYTNKLYDKTTTIRIAWRDTPAYMRAAKQFTYSLLQMTVSQINTFIQELQYWDGCTDSNCIVYYTNNKTNAEIVQTLAHLINKAARFKTRPPRDNWKASYTVRIRNRNTHKHSAKYMEHVPDTNPVYCPTVGSGYFVCKSNTTIYITGNSGADKLQLQNLPRGGAARSSLQAPPGHVLLVCDLSQVELRMSAWFSGQQDILDIFIAGLDVYKDMATKIYGVKYNDVTKAQRMVAKVTCLGLGFMCGIPTFDAMLKAGAMGPKVVLPLLEVGKIHTVYRKTNDKIVATWRKAGKWLEHMFEDTILPPAHYKGLTFSKGQVQMPNGTVLRYPGMRADPMDGITYSGANGMRKRIYSGLFYENCIAEDTQVLTNRGWVYIQNILDTDLVHDGIEFTSHAGLLYKGKQQCIVVDNVYLTPDHEVLDDAQNWTPASQLQGLYRPKIRDNDGDKIRRTHYYNKAAFNIMGVFMWLRQACSKTGHECSKKTNHKTKLRVLKPNRKTYYPCHEQNSNIRSVEWYDKAMQTTFAPSLEKLWRARNTSVRFLEQEFFQFFSRYGKYLSTGLAVRSNRQQRQLYAYELPLGYSQSKRVKPQEHYKSKHPKRDNDGRTNINQLRDKKDYSTLSNEKPARKKVVTTRKAVYDIKNCGPRTRFVVKGKEGPFIVHNCIQSLARHVIAEQLVNISQKYDVVLSVHDELIMSVPFKVIDEATVFVEKEMRTSPAWCPDLPLDCEADYSIEYSK